MLSYNFAETAVCESSDVGKYAPIAKLMFKDRTFNVSNAVVTFSLLTSDANPLKVKITSRPISDAEIYLHKLSNSTIDCFIIANPSDQYATLYVKGLGAGDIAVMTIDSAENANMFTPIWGGKFSEDKSSATYTMTDSARLSGIKTKYLTATTGATGNIGSGAFNQKTINAYAKGYIVIPFQNAYNTQQYYKVLNVDMTVAANVEVTLAINYWSE